MSLNVSFGVSTWLWTSPFTTESCSLFSKIKSMGFDAVEIPVEDPSLIDNKKLKEELIFYGLTPVVCGAFGPTRDFTHEDPAIHRNCFTYLDACFKLCVDIGAKFLAGPAYSAVGKARLATFEQKKIEWERAVANLKIACQRASDVGLEMALEPLNRFESDMINTTDDVLRLIKDINHVSAKILLDGFHMNIEEPDMERAIMKAGKKLLHVQVSENYRGTPGSGQTRWDAIYRGLQAIEYKGVVTIESFTPDNKELAGAVCIWRPLAISQDHLALDGLTFLKRWASQK